MLLRKLLVFTVVIFIFSCSSVPDISRWNGESIPPWLTLSENPSTSVTVNWFTHESSKTTLLLGKTRTALHSVTSPSGDSRLHSIALEGLSPGTVYYYRIGEKIYHFKTASDKGKYRITVVGDMQPYQADTIRNNRIVSKALAAKAGDLVVQLGDVAENGGINVFWLKTLSYISRFSSSRPFIAAAGNHDYYWNGKENFRRIFPYNYPSDKELYHSLDYRNSTLIFLDYHVENPTLSTDQMKWLEKELKRASADKNRWVFLFFHGTLISAGRNYIDNYLSGELRPLLDKYKVDGIFFGHIHTYEHWLYNGKTQVFLCGAGGSSLGKDDIPEDIYPRMAEAKTTEKFGDRFTFLYGKQVLHYIDLDFSGKNNSICTISVHFPEGQHPRKWIIKKGD